MPKICGDKLGREIAVLNYFHSMDSKASENLQCFFPVVGSQLTKLESEVCSSLET